MKPHRVAYVNGNIVPEEEATISIHDMGFVYGDCVFDSSRTFNGKLFRLQEHLDRLYQSLGSTGIDCGIPPDEMARATQEVVGLNLPALRPGEDYWVTQRISTGLQQLDGESQSRSPTVVIECMPLPLRARARYFLDGIDAVVPERVRIPPAALSPNIKSNNYLNMMLAQREVQKDHPEAWALMCDIHGNLAEGAGCNFFMVADGVVYTSTREFVLAGVSRQVVIEWCEENGMEVRETDISMDFALTGQEAFLTSTSLCACPVSRLNGHLLSGGAPGPVTDKIMRGFANLVGFDYVGQYLSFLGEGEGSTGL
ncbi:MAG: aminotransferase class IV [Gammaproteobacteria bacterium]|nr:aminotransferase class IV [Gammaproteobacteria bacterium]